MLLLEQRRGRGKHKASSYMGQAMICTTFGRLGHQFWLYRRMEGFGGWFLPVAEQAACEKWTSFC